MMTIEVDGLEQAIRRLQDAGKDVLAVIEPSIRQGALAVEAYMKKYPSPPEGSLYRRTGTLGRRWTTRFERSGVEVAAQVGNNTGYGPWVQRDGETAGGEPSQAWMHRGRWQTDYQAEQEIGPRIQDSVAAAVRSALSG